MDRERRLAASFCVSNCPDGWLKRHLDSVSGEQRVYICDPLLTWLMVVSRGLTRPPRRLERGTLRGFQYRVRGLCSGSPRGERSWVARLVGRQGSLRRGFALGTFRCAPPSPEEGIHTCPARPRPPISARLPLSGRAPRGRGAQSVRTERSRRYRE